MCWQEGGALTRLGLDRIQPQEGLVLLAMDERLKRQVRHHVQLQLPTMDEDENEKEVQEQQDLASAR